MNGNKTVLLNFSQNGYTLTLSVVGSGYVTKNPDKVTYNSGEIVQLAATPATGYSFNGWSGDMTGNSSPTTIVMNGNKTVTISFSVLPGSGGNSTPGGSFFGGEGSGVVLSGPGITNLTLYTNSNGLFNIEGQAKSEDGKVNLVFAKNVLAQTYDNTQLKSIKIVAVDSPKDAPPGNLFVGLTYDLTPEGATFSPAIPLTIYYDPANLTGIDVNSLTIVVFNPTTSSWESLQSIINKVDGSITVYIEHFSIYSIVGKKAEPPTAIPTLSLPKFNVSDLTVNPASGTPEHSVTITTKISNTGGTRGVYEVDLQIDGAVEQTKKINVEAGSSTTVSFDVTRSNPGYYLVEVNGATTYFTLSEIPQVTNQPPQIPEPQSSGQGTNWLVTGIIIAAVVIIGGVTVMVFRKRHV
jgi:uncharacterized repeat protein (TIGR02543 family)